MRRAQVYFQRDGDGRVRGMWGLPLAEVEAVLDPAGEPVATVEPLDPAQLSDLPFGYRGFWSRPWRAAQDSWSAARMGDALGINFNPPAGQEGHCARLLASAGFKHVRVEIGWNSMNMANQLVGVGTTEARLAACQAHGLRPLICLNSNHGNPCPNVAHTGVVTATAAAGTRSVAVNEATAAAVVVGRTGFSNLTQPKLCEAIVTAVDGLTLSLSRPLPVALAAGSHAMHTLLYQPFSWPRYADGSPNPRYAETLGGWRIYLDAVAAFVGNLLGDADAFDMEIWNEMSFGADFLQLGLYYDPMPEDRPPTNVPPLDDITIRLFNDSVEWIRRADGPAGGGVGVTNGFASQTPFGTPSYLRAGTTALSKHYYRGHNRYPAGQPKSSLRPIDVNGDPDGTLDGTTWHDSFVPTYTEFYPEVTISGVMTETLYRDLTGLPNDIFGLPHGRNAPTMDGGAPLEVWMTEWNIETTGLVLTDPGAPAGPPLDANLSDADNQHIRAKALIRFMAAMVGSGLQRVYFYSAHDGNLSLVTDAFFSPQPGGAYPGDAAAGKVINVLRRFMEAFGDEQPEAPPMPLQVVSIGSFGNSIVFAGDGTARHPDLRHLDVVAAFPFWSSQGWVIPAYVMTYNVGEDRTDSVVGPTRMDLPAERYRLELAGVGPFSTVEVYDPMLDEHTPFRIVSRTGTGLVLEAELTDSPRIIQITRA